MKIQCNIDIIQNNHVNMVIGKTFLYKYKMNEVKHYSILSQTCIHVSFQIILVQFNWSISKN